MEDNVEDLKSGLAMATSIRGEWTTDDKESVSEQFTLLYFVGLQEFRLVTVLR